MLVGLMVLIFLRDWRSALVVLLNIPLALMSALIALWLSGQTINIMTLGGLALAIGILVDEATVAIENIHSRLERGQPLARAVRDGAGETAVPRFLAMVCILAIFVSAFFMQGAARAMFVPLSLAVGFSMAASYVLSSTLVPVASVWLLRRVTGGRSAPTMLDRAGVSQAMARGLWAAVAPRGSVSEDDRRRLTFLSRWRLSWLVGIAPWGRRFFRWSMRVSFGCG